MNPGVDGVLKEEVGVPAEITNVQDPPFGGFGPLRVADGEVKDSRARAVVGVRESHGDVHSLAVLGDERVRRVHFDLLNVLGVYFELLNNEASGYLIAVYRPRVPMPRNAAVVIGVEVRQKVRLRHVLVRILESVDED